MTFNQLIISLLVATCSVAASYSQTSALPATDSIGDNDNNYIVFGKLKK